MYRLPRGLCSRVGQEKITKNTWALHERITTGTRPELNRSGFRLNHWATVVKAEARSVRFRSCASRTFLTWLIDAYDMTPSHRRWALYESSTSDKMVGSGKEPQAIFMFLFGSHVGHIVYLKKKATQAPQARFFCISSCLQPLSVCRHQIRLKNTSIICAFWSQPHILSLHCNC